MAIIGILRTRIEAQKLGKQPFFFSRFNFERMQELKNTHYCFDCAGRQGFTYGPNKEILNSADKDNWDAMKDHDPKTHTAIIGNAEKYLNPWTWLEKELPEDFPYLVHIPEI